MVGYAEVLFLILCCIFLRKKLFSLIVVQCKTIFFTTITDMCNWIRITYKWYRISYEYPFLILLKVERAFKNRCVEI